MAEIRRLVVCLDGTWNNRDDSTNVLHHFALTPECRDRKVVGDSVTQLKLYLEGVGTGPLDAITGGGFGFGLETNVRAAYNWLVQNYRGRDGLHARRRDLHLRLQPRRVHRAIARRLHQHLRPAAARRTADGQRALANLLPDRPRARAS